MSKPKSNSIRLIFTLVGLFLVISLSGQNMNQHKWKNRILILNTSNEESPFYKKQIEELSLTTRALKERKLVLYEIRGDQYKFTDFQHLENDLLWKKIKEIDRDVLMDKSTFKIRLIGLDGGLKLVKTKILKRKELFDLIDSMPMRIQEIRK